MSLNQKCLKNQFSEAEQKNNHLQICQWVYLKFKNMFYHVYAITVKFATQEINKNENIIKKHFIYKKKTQKSTPFCGFTLTHE